MKCSFETREWAAIQRLFSLRRTRLNYPNESECGDVAAEQGDAAALMYACARGAAE